MPIVLPVTLDIANGETEVDLPFQFTPAFREDRANDEPVLQDIPTQILRWPPPRPAELVHLEHYYTTPSGERKDLAACHTAEDRVDALANELAELQRLFSGYAETFRRYFALLDERQRKVQAEFETAAAEGPLDCSSRLEDRRKGLSKDLNRQLSAIRARFAGMVNTAGRSLPRRVKANKKKCGPRMKDRETHRRAFEHRTLHRAGFLLEDARKKLGEDAFVVSLLDPPLLPARGGGLTETKDSAVQLQPHEDQDVSKKIERLSKSLDEFYQAVAKIRELTENQFMALRRAGVTMEANTIEFEFAQVAMERCVQDVHVDAANLEHEIRNLERWASELTTSAVDASSTAATNAGSTSSTVHQPLAPVSPTTIIPSEDPQTASVLGPDVYAVCVDVAVDKPIDDLSREEAIELLKTLPLHVKFVPCAEDGFERPSVVPPPPPLPIPGEPGAPLLPFCWLKPKGTGNDPPASSSSGLSIFRKITGIGSKEASQVEQRKRSREDENVGDALGGESKRPRKEMRLTSRFRG